MGNYGLRISTKGNKADTQLNNRLGYSSKFLTLKIFKKGQIKVTTNGSGVGTGKVVHGLGYAPTFYVFRQSTASFSLLDATSYQNTFSPGLGTSNTWIPYHQKSDAYTDATNLTIYIEGSNSTDYYFTYYIFIDPAQVTAKTGEEPELDYGLRIGKQGIDALQAKEHQLNLSTGYAMLRYYPEMTSDFLTLTLPAMSSDYGDHDPQEGTYVDFFHPFGYPPFFLAYAESSFSPGVLTSVPEVGSVIVPIYGPTTSVYEISAWCDKSRLRITFYRKAEYNTSLNYAVSFLQETYKIRVYFFEENLSIGI